jgi:type I restriction enzyme S subunit
MKSNWEKVKLSDIAEITMGQSPKSSYYNSVGKGMPFLQGNRTFGILYPTFDTWTTVVTKKAKAGDIIMSVRAPVGDINFAPIDICLGRGVCSIRDKNNNQDFLYYLIKYMKPCIIKKGVGTVFGSINSNDIKNLEICIPKSNKAQQKIIKILKSIDEKIEINNKINKELVQTAKDIYNYWFVQFDFPDKDKRPYKSNNGKMVYNEVIKKEIPYGWTVKKIKDFCNVITGKEDANFATNTGQYAFFTCGDKTLKCDIPQFEGKAILIAGNGIFNVKYFEGKFNAYQRTYVLIPQEENILGIMYKSAIDNINNFIRGANGSIVKFITKSDIENINLLIPNNMNLANIFNSILSKINSLKKENIKLSDLRDWLLPMLLSGQVNVLD